MYKHFNYMSYNNYLVDDYIVNILIYISVINYTIVYFITLTILMRIMIMFTLRIMLFIHFNILIIRS